MKIIRFLRNVKNNPEYMYGYLMGLRDSGDLSDELSEDMRERVAEKMEEDLVDGLLKERNYLLEVISRINEATDLGDVKDLVDSKSDEDKNTGSGFSYIG